MKTNTAYNDSHETWQNGCMKENPQSYLSTNDCMMFSPMVEQQKEKLLSNCPFCHWVHMVHDKKNRILYKDNYTSKIGNAVE